MYRVFLILLALTLLPLSGMAEAPLTFADDLTGVYTWPEGSSEEDASYVYHYTYPQLAGESDLAMAFNYIFEYEATDALGFECPMNGSSHPAELGQMQVTISYTITHQSKDFLSVRIDKEAAVGDDVSTVIKAYTFTLTGPNAGTVTALPYILGLLEQGETDEWYIERQTTKADDCTRELVWMQIEKAMKDESSLIWDDLAFVELEYGFYPEEDFFMNEDGDLVFFLQEDVIAPPEAGQFFFPITLDELLDEI